MRAEGIFPAEASCAQPFPHGICFGTSMLPVLRGLETVVSVHLHHREELVYVIKRTS